MCTCDRSFFPLATWETPDSDRHFGDLAPLCRLQSKQGQHQVSAFANLTRILLRPENPVSSSPSNPRLKSLGPQGFPRLIYTSKAPAHPKAYGLPSSEPVNSVRKLGTLC